MENANLTALLKSYYVPTILVIPSVGAEKICRKISSPLSELFSTYGRMGHSVKVKSINEQQYEVRGLQVLFTSLQDLEKLSAPTDHLEKQNLAHLQEIASQNSSEECYSNVKLRNSRDVTELRRDLQKKDCTPWFNIYRWEYIRNIGISETEYFNHPIACITVISSDSKDPCGEVTSLYDERNPPSVFRRGVIDPNLPKFYLVLHDHTANHRIDTCLNQLRATFERNKIFHLSLNSLGEQNSEGTQLSSEDHQQIEELVKAFITRGIIPHLEKSILALNEMVEASKKGIKNQLKGWFGIGKKSSKHSEKVASIIPEKTIYPLSSVESSQKRLGDYLFMIQDYSEAFNVYKNALRDYSTDKSWKYYAATSEMCGLCLFCLDPSKRELESYFENAWHYYIKDTMFRYAIRVTFYFTEILKIRKNLVDATQKLIRAAERPETDKLTAALLHEQAAFSFLFMSPPQFRKYSMRLVLAGRYFLSFNLDAHSFRCYSSAYSTYEDKNWHWIEDHIDFILAKQSLSLGHIDSSVFYIDKLLNNFSSKSKQNQYLHEFLQIYKKVGEKKGINIQKLPLPKINNQSLVVFLRDYPPKSPLQDLWNQMKDDLKNEGKKTKFYLFQQPKKNKPKIAVVEEKISIDVNITNTLAVPLEFSEMKLMATHETEEKVDISEDSLQITPFDLLLGANETKKLHFSIRAMKEGILTIKGISFLLNKTVKGYREFELPKKRLNDTIEHQKGVFYQDNLDLTMRITKPMPLLEVDIKQFPQNLFQGEFHQAQLILKNSGTSALKNVKVKLSHPVFFFFCKTSHEVEGSSDDSIVHIPFENDSLQPNEHISIPVWIRGHKAGSHSLHLLFYYESEIPNPEMKYRLARYSNKIKIMPSFKVSNTIISSYSDVNTYLLNLQIENVQDTNKFTLKKLMVQSPLWSLEPLSLSNEDLLPGEVTNLIFRVIPRNEQNNQNEFLLCSSDDQTFQKESYPLFGFLARERVYTMQKKKLEISEGQLELILLWETHQNERVIHGQHNVSPIYLETHSGTHKEANEDWIRFSIDSPREVSFDFSSGSFCIVPVTFWVNNCSKQSISFYLETLKPHEAPEHSSGEQLSYYFWGGTTRHYVDCLGPNSKISLEGFVVFSSPGIHNLSKYRISLKDVQRNARRVLSPRPHIIVVKALSS